MAVRGSSWRIRAKNPKVLGREPEGRESGQSVPPLPRARLDQRQLDLGKVQQIIKTARECETSTRNALYWCLKGPIDWRVQASSDEVAQARKTASILQQTFSNVHDGLGRLKLTSSRSSRSCGSTGRRRRRRTRAKSRVEYLTTERSA